MSVSTILHGIVEHEKKGKEINIRSCEATFKSSYKESPEKIRTASTIAKIFILYLLCIYYDLDHNTLNT